MAEQDIVERLRKPVEVKSAKGFFTETNFVVDPLHAEAANLIASLRLQLAEARETEFNRGYVLACCNLVNLHDEPSMAFDALSELGVTRSDIKALDLTDYDKGALRKIEKSYGNKSLYRSSRRALPHPDREGERE